MYLNIFPGCPKKIARYTTNLNHIVTSSKMKFYYAYFRIFGDF